MAEALVSAQQSFPAANVLATLYTAPSVAGSAVPTLIVNNQSPNPAHFWVSVAPGGAADAAQQYLFGAFGGAGVSIPGGTTVVLTTGITLAQNDVVRVKSDNGMISFNLMGVLQE